MRRIIEREIPDVNTFGGGTLITPNNEFWEQIEKGQVAVSIGVSENWNGEHADALKQFSAIYVRDLYSYWRLMPYNLWPILSVDLWNVLVAPKRKRFRKVANVENLSHKSVYLDKFSTMIRDRCRKEGYEFFSTSPDHIKTFAPESKVFESGQELIDYLAEAEVAYVTRLHALVAAWIAGVPDIRPIIYDPKCQHFLDRMRLFTPEEAHAKIMADLEQIRQFPA